MVEQHPNFAIEAEKPEFKLSKFVGNWQWSENAGDWRGYRKEFGSSFIGPLLYSLGKIIMILLILN